jgi:hypothetical protein
MRRFSEAEWAVTWDMREAGVPVKGIARHLGRENSSLRKFLAGAGGRRPRPARCSELRLSLAEREEISRGLAAGWSLRMIASGLHRAPSTVSREFAVSGGPRKGRRRGALRRFWPPWHDQHRGLDRLLAEASGVSGHPAGGNGPPPCLAKPTARRGWERSTPKRFSRTDCMVLKPKSPSQNLPWEPGSASVIGARSRPFDLPDNGDHVRQRPRLRPFTRPKPRVRT